MMTKVICLELVDWHFPSSPVTFPARTATAYKIPGCECTEYVPEQYIYPFKHCVRDGVCNHTENSHGKADEPQQAKKPKRVKR